MASRVMGHFTYRGERVELEDREPNIAEHILLDRAGLDLTGGDAVRLFSLAWLAARKRYGDVQFVDGFDQETMTSLDLTIYPPDKKSETAGEGETVDPSQPSGPDGESKPPRAVRRSAGKKSAATGSRAGATTARSNGTSSRSTAGTRRARSTS